MLLQEPTRKMVKEVRYKAELGGKNGYEINGIEGYWGRYASLEKIEELARTLQTENNSFSFYFPAPQYEYKYSHRIFLYGTKKPGSVLIEFEEASDQCGTFNKTINFNKLKSELIEMKSICLDPESYGYIYEYY